MADEIGLEYETFDEAMNHDPFMYRIRELIRTGVRSPFDQLLGALNKINDPAVCYVQGIQQSRATLENIRSESSNPPFTNIDRIAATILQHTGPGLGNYLLDLHAYTGTQTRALVAENRTLGRKGLHKILVECVDPVSKVPISGILRAETVEDYLVGLISPDIGTLSHKEIWERRKRLRDLKRYTMKKATLSIPLNGSRVMATESQVLQDANIKYFDIFNATAKAKRIIDVTKGLGAEINGGYLIMLYPDIGTDQDHAVPLYITPHGELRNAVLTAKGELHTIPLHTPRSNFERLEMVIWQAIASRRIEEASCRSNGGGDGGGESTRQDALVVALNPGANRRRVKIGSAGGPQRFHKLREYLETVLQDPALVHYPLREPHAFNDALYREYEKLRDMYGPVVDDLYEEGPDGIRVDTLLIKLLLYKSHNFEFDIILGKEATDQNGRKYQIRRGFDRTTDITWRDTPTELRLRAI